MTKQRIYMAWGVVLDLPSSDINQAGMTCWKHCSKTYRSRSKKWRFFVGSDWDSNVALNIIHSVCKESAYNAGDCLHAVSKSWTWLSDLTTFTVKYKQQIIQYKRSSYPGLNCEQLIIAMWTSGELIKIPV